MLLDALHSCISGIWKKNHHCLIYFLYLTSSLLRVETATIWQTKRYIRVMAMQAITLSSSFYNKKLYICVRRLGWHNPCKDFKLAFRLRNLLLIKTFLSLLFLGKFVVTFSTFNPDRGFPFINFWRYQVYPYCPCALFVVSAQLTAGLFATLSF